MHLTPEDKAIGKENFQAAIGSPLTRREFLQGSIAAGVTAGGAGLGAYYYGYAKELAEPVRVGMIGTGDEGGVLIGAHNPAFVQIAAIADIRPYNIWRAFNGDQSSANALKARPGLMSKYGWKSQDEAEKHVDVYTDDYHELLDDPDIEAVIIALPLHLHAKVAIEAMQRGKHVLTEKLMAHSVHECKEMSRWAQKSWDDNGGAKGLYLATGHQRHYNVLYDNAIFTIQQGLIGDIHHIRAQWHRGNLPGRDSWSQPLPADLVEKLKTVEKKLESATGKRRSDLLTQQTVFTQKIADGDVDAEKYGYETIKLSDGRTRSALEELVRWRLWNRTGGGLMAELGSHQLDAASLFISALNPDGGEVHPLSVTGVGGRHIFPLDRDCEDHVYCSYEFPGPLYAEDPNKKIVVTYSSINGNGFGGYGEVVMGTTGTLVLEREKDVMLFKNSSTATKVKVSEGKDGPTLDTTESGGDAVGKMATDSGVVSRGYREEIEHWAWCIRNTDPANQPKCRPSVALPDAVIALTSTIAIRDERRINLDPAWFDIESDETPEGIAPKRPT